VSSENHDEPLELQNRNHQHPAELRYDGVVKKHSRESTTYIIRPTDGAGYVEEKKLEHARQDEMKEELIAHFVPPPLEEDGSEDDDAHTQERNSAIDRRDPVQNCIVVFVVVE
jgi:hypothetical protein